MADQTAGSSADGGHQAKSPIEKHTEEPAPSADAQTVSAKDEGEVDEDEGEVKEDSSQHEAESSESTLAAQLAKYKWYKCIADPAQYGPGHYYYTQTETGESSWTEPTEPYWIWDAVAGAVDSTAGLQIPRQSPPQPQAAAVLPEDYQGYNPKIHGNYDPNASYAKFHTRQQQADYDALLASTAAQNPDAAAVYASTMILNRFSGATQTNTDAGPERHSDTAKSTRQMNAFFDVDSAANAHDGRSLKAERQAQRLTKQQVREFNEKRAERKHKKRMAQLLN